MHLFYSSLPQRKCSTQLTLMPIITLISVLLYNNIVYFLLGEYRDRVGRNMYFTPPGHEFDSIDSQQNFS